MSDCNCKRFCETCGRDNVQHDPEIGEYCEMCADDGFNGELCSPAPHSCSLGAGAMAANRWERQFMCWRHKIVHWWFCWRNT